MSGPAMLSTRGAWLQSAGMIAGIYICPVVLLATGVIPFLSTLLFGFMHIIYKNLATVLLTLAAGLIWAVMFNTTRKVFIVAVSHAVLAWRRSLRHHLICDHREFLYRVSRIGWKSLSAKILAGRSL